MALPRNKPMIKVADLIEMLKAFPEDAVIVQSHDSEGNNFSPVSAVTLGLYQEETTWNGEFTDVEEDMADLEGQGAQKAVCLWPTY